MEGGRKENIFVMSFKAKFDCDYLLPLLHRDCPLYREIAPSTTRLPSLFVCVLCVVPSHARKLSLCCSWCVLSGRVCCLDIRSTNVI